MVDSNNPYQAPSAYTLDASEQLAENQLLPLQPANPFRALLRWSFICFISAAPSFFWGLLIAEDNHAMKSVAMVTGILIFVVLYTAADCSKLMRRLATNRTFRLVTRIGFGTRIAISILFPIGIYVDLIIGMFSIGTVSLFLPGSVSPLQDNFWAFLATTLVQGIYMNMLLLGYMLVVFGIVRIFRAIRDH